MRPKHDSGQGFACCNAAWRAHMEVMAAGTDAPATVNN